MARIRAGFVSGQVSNNPLSSSGTTLNSSALADLPVISSPDVAAIVLDPEGSSGAPEIVHVTAHSASATTATISRGEEGTTARSHAQNTDWVHGPTPADFLQGILGYEQEDSNVVQDIVNNSTVEVLSVTVDVPTGTRLVKIEFFALVRNTDTGTQNFGLVIKEDASTLENYFVEFPEATNSEVKTVHISLIRQVSGGSHTYSVEANANGSAADGLSFNTTVGAYPVHLAVHDLGPA